MQLIFHKLSQFQFKVIFITVCSKAHVLQIHTDRALQLSCLWMRPTADHELIKMCLINYVRNKLW